MTRSLTFPTASVLASVLVFGWYYGLVFQLLSLGLLAYGLRHERPAACAVGGGLLALCLYSYLGHRLLPLTAVPLLAAYLARGPGMLRHRLMLSLVFAAGFLVIAVPWLGIVMNNSTLLWGDIQSNSVQTQGLLHQGIPATVSLLLDHARTMLFGLFVGPGNDPPEFVVSGAGIFDMLTTVLIVLSLLYGLTRFWRVEYATIFLTVALVLLEASAGSTDALWIYRLNSMVPMLFLAVALLLDRCAVLLDGIAQRRRYVVATALLIGGWGSVINVHTLSAQLSNCDLVQNDALSVGNSEPLLQAEAANAVDRHQAAFVISAHNFWPLFQWQWAYRSQPPVYVPVPKLDPSRWPMQFSAWPNNVPPQGYARFWPPRLAPGQTGVTYVVDQDAGPAFLPLLEHAYPGGLRRVLQPAVCPAFQVTTYSLTTLQVHPRRNG